MRALVRRLLPVVLLATVLFAPSRTVRLGALGALLALWTAVHRRYRSRGQAQTAHEYELLGATDWEAFDRHYKECVGTIDEEFDIWGPYHQHRHEMRYDLVASAVRDHLPPGGRVLDVGCGGALVADRISDVAAWYVGVDIPDQNLLVAAAHHQRAQPLWTAWARAGAEGLPLADASIDVVVFSEVIEHLRRPELAVWEISRVLRPGGHLIMTTNNASEVPTDSPLANPFAWLEKVYGATHPRAISLRPWVWPQPVDPALAKPGSPPVYLAHTHHIYAETRRMFTDAGLTTIEWSTFEFPPPHSATAAMLERRGPVGRRGVDVLEAVARRTPLVRRLGCHLMMVSRKDGAPVASEPPPGVWPGPFSGG